MGTDREQEYKRLPHFIGWKPDYNFDRLKIVNAAYNMLSVFHYGVWAAETGKYTDYNN